MKDFIEIEQSVFHETGLDCVFEELSGSFQIFEDTCSSVILNRNSSDVSAINYSCKLVDFCKSFSLFILNGRTKGDLTKGKSTCKNVSCFD